MRSIGITEQEVLEYTESREQHEEDVGEPPSIFDYNTDPIVRDSLTSLNRLNARIEELKSGK